MVFQPFLVLPFLGCSVLNKENLQIYQGFSFPAERREFLKNKIKDPFKQGNSLLKIKQGNPNNQGKEGQGCNWRILPLKPQPCPPHPPLPLPPPPGTFCDASDEEPELSELFIRS